jgi:arabinogalactan endo-1,4-beta-galactosidase
MGLKVKGVDLSTLKESEKQGAIYKLNGKPSNVFQIFKDNGLNLVRLRLWNNPYSEDGEPYEGGTCDLPTIISLAKQAQEFGYDILLDFHYSDFWCDPSHQYIPKAWHEYSLTELAQAVYEYTKETLLTLQKEKIELAYIQVGNEITNGFLWPVCRLIENSDGTKSNYESLTLVLKAGLKAVKEVYPNSKTMLHLERSYDQFVYNEFLSKMAEANVLFDVLGMSYYPYWHKSIQELSDNIQFVQKKFHLEIMIVEIGFPYTTEKAWKVYLGKDDLEENEKVTFLSNLEKMLGFEISVEGQYKFILNLAKKLEELNVLGIVYWEPTWINLPSSTWASLKAREYLHCEHIAGGNEWSSQTLFDNDGNALDSIAVFKKI